MVIFSLPGENGDPKYFSRFAFDKKELKRVKKEFKAGHKISILEILKDKDFPRLDYRAERRLEELQGEYPNK